MRANEELEDFEDTSLIDELENRGYNIPIDQAPLLNKVYWQIRDGANVSDEMRKLIAGLTGRIL